MDEVLLEVVLYCDMLWPSNFVRRVRPKCGGLVGKDRGCRCAAGGSWLFLLFFPFLLLLPLLLLVYVVVVVAAVFQKSGGAIFLGSYGGIKGIQVGAWVGTQLCVGKYTACLLVSTRRVGW
jgi:hypothetical protein